MAEWFQSNGLLLGLALLDGLAYAALGRSGYEKEARVLEEARASDPRFCF